MLIILKTHHSDIQEHNTELFIFGWEQMLAWNPASGWTLTEVLRREDKRELPYRVQYTVRDERKPESLTKKTKNKKTNTNALWVLKTEVFELFWSVQPTLTFLEYKFTLKFTTWTFSATFWPKELRCFVFSLHPRRPTTPGSVGPWHEISWS